MPSIEERERNASKKNKKKTCRVGEPEWKETRQNHEVIYTEKKSKQTKNNRFDDRMNKEKREESKNEKEKKNRRKTKKKTTTATREEGIR